MSAGTVRTRTASGVLTDVVREDPVDRRQTRTRRVLFWCVVAAVVLSVVLCTVGA